MWKNSAWEKIYETLTENCKTARLASAIRKIQRVVDNNMKTSSGRESFEFIEILDVFLGCYDKVRPQFVKQTSLLENEKNT